MLPAGCDDCDPRTDRVLEITGTVQGVGFRPFVARLARGFGLRGWVRNDTRGVRLRIAGPHAVLDEFEAALRRQAPPAAHIAQILARPAGDTPDLEGLPPTGFSILASEKLTSPPSVALSPDLALCAECRRELLTEGDRRQGYPFINCTQCGPRYSIVRTLPYDRPRTTMAGFRMCPACQAEYADPENRRYHAQPNACPICGPRVELQDRDGKFLAEAARAIALAVSALLEGRILAAKGLGGYHLMVDAANSSAIEELRRRKRRDEKPFAVMFPTLEEVRRHAEMSPREEAWLIAPSAPIVLLRRRSDTALAEAVAPGNPWIGAMLPHTPLQVLLLNAVARPLVATSGNLSEDPLCTDETAARERLGAIADLFLIHNRPIARPVDDSVIRRCHRGPLHLRRARGFAPAPLTLPPGTSAPVPLLCLGSHQKNTVAVAAGSQVVLSPHLGDLANPASVQAFERAIDLLRSLYEVEIATVACDAHPDYHSTRHAESLGLPIVRVQHHLAHILACLLEHGGGPPQVLGVAWDGTGYGPDGTIWGGEFIVVDRTRHRARRIAHLRPFRLPGGEAAVREPRRAALGMLYECFGYDRARIEPLAVALGFGSHDLALLDTMLQRGLNTPVTTSGGRLFDGIAALLQLRQRASFEGQAAMAVEFAAESEKGTSPWPLPLIGDGDDQCWQIDWTPAVAAVVDPLHAGRPELLAAKFHASLTQAIADVAKRAGISTVVLTGGCFQNVRLLDATAELLRADGFAVLQPIQLPPNDGAISAGQSLAALWGITTVDLPPSRGTR